jgi:multidrug efflux system outer membrane protein
VDTEPRRTYTTSEKAGLGLDVRYEVDLWGRIRRSTDAALADLLATEEAYRTVTITLIADVASTYFTLVDLDQRLEISERTAKTRGESLDIMKARYKGGAISQVDYEQAAIQLADAEATIQVFKRLRTQTENGLSVLLGFSPQPIKRGAMLKNQVFPPKIPLGLPSELLLRRPDVLQAEQNLAAQTARIGLAEAARYPSLILSGNVGGEVANNNLSSGIAAIAASLAGPLFDGGRTKKQVAIEVARTQGLLLEYEQSILNAFREVEDAVVAVETYKAEYEARARQESAALSAAKLAKVRYDGGWTGYLEVLENERSLFAAELKASEAQKFHFTSMVSLYRALGGGWTEDDPEESASTPRETEGTP